MRISCPISVSGAVDYFANFGKVSLGCTRRRVISNVLRRKLRYNLVLKVRPVICF